MHDVPEHPIAYTALQSGTSVQTIDGTPFATVRAVLVDEKVAVFDGIVVQTVEGRHVWSREAIAQRATNPTLLRAWAAPVARDAHRRSDQDGRRAV